MVFVNSMSDLFHEDVPDDYIVAVAAVMQRANWHTYQVLTKRSDRLRGCSLDREAVARGAAHLVGRQRREPQARPAADRAPAERPAAVRFLRRAAAGRPRRVDLDGIHWVIVGGESGPGARPMRPDWVRRSAISARARVPFFFKQWGGVRKKATGGSWTVAPGTELPTAAPAL